MKPFLFLCIVCILLVPFTSALVTINGTSIERFYKAGDSIRGSINMAFKDVDLDATVSSNLVGSTTLRSWLNAHGLVGGTNYNCSTPGCSAQLKKDSSITSLALSNSSRAGFSFEGQSFLGLDSLQFTVQGTSPASCSPPLIVQLGDDPTLTLSSTAYLDQVCAQPAYGCFDAASGTSNAEIPSDGQYCEKITLPAAPAFRVGGRIINTTGSASQLVMKLYGEDSSTLGECTLPALTSAVETVSCLIPFSSSKEQSYFVCINAKSPSKYAIRTEGVQPCGTVNFGETYPRDYELYAQGLTFATPSLTINEETFAAITGQGLRSSIENYIADNYEGSCEPECIVPFTFRGPQQTLIFSSVDAVYDIDGASNIHTTDLYSFSARNVTINAGFQQLDLSKLGFTLPLGKNVSSFTLSIGSQKILNESITVAPSFDFTLGPSVARVGIATSFGIGTTRNISSVSWDFGDSTPIQTTQGKTISHRYTQTGIFNLTVEASDRTGASSRKTISVYVGEAKEAANFTIQDYQSRVNSIDKNLSTYPLWVQAAVKKALEIDSAKATVESVARTYLTTENETDYVELINRLLALRIPRQLVQTGQGSLPLLAGLESVDTSLAAQVTSQEVPNRADFISNLAYWTTQHYNAEISYTIVSAVYDIELEPFFTIITVNPREIATSEESYLVIGVDPTAITSAAGYEERALAGGLAYKVAPGASYSFMILDAIDPSQLGAFIVPVAVDPLLTSSEAPLCKIDNFCDANAGEDAASCPQDCASHIGFYVSVSLILIAILGVVLAVVWWWYRTRYERSLFPMKNDLLNILGFIGMQKRAGVSDKDIKEKLKKAGWTGEQISYALRKMEQRQTPAKPMPPKK